MWGSVSTDDAVHEEGWRRFIGSREEKPKVVVVGKKDKKEKNGKKIEKIEKEFKYLKHCGSELCNETTHDILFSCPDLD